MEVQRTIHSLIWGCLKPPFIIPAQSKPWGAHNPRCFKWCRAVHQHGRYSKTRNSICILGKRRLLLTIYSEEWTDRGVLKNASEFVAFLRVEHLPSWAYGSQRLQQLFRVVKNRAVGILKSNAVRSELLMSASPGAKAVLLFLPRASLPSVMICTIWLSFFKNIFIFWLCQNTGMSIGTS